MTVLDILRALVTGDAAKLNSTDWQAEALATLDRAEQPAADELDGQAPDGSGPAVEAGREEA